MKPICFIITFGLYFLSLIAYFVNFELKQSRFSRWASRLLMLGLLSHLLFLVFLFQTQYLSTLSNISEYLVPFFILLVSLILEKKFKGHFFMLFTLPVALLISLFAMIHANTAPSQIFRLNSGWLWLHLSFILTGLAGLLTAVSTALMYLLQSRQIKSKHLSNVFFKLPSLDVLDRVHFYSLEWGIILFSLGVLSGLFWAHDLGGLHAVFADKKVILSLATCAVYWFILALRLSPMRRGKKIAVGTILVFVLLLMTIATSHEMSAVAAG